MAFIQSVVDSYNHIIYEKADQRVLPWFLMSSPVPVLLIIAAYLWFVLKAGPAFMKNRQPFQLNGIIQIYNIIQVLLCAKLTIFGFTQVYGPWGRYSFFCEPMNFEVTEFNMSVLGHFYLYFILKVVDLLDTVFFVLRKKDNQVSFLHVYHHTIMVAVIWYALRYLSTGHEVYVGCINSLVHTVMYAYYFLTNYNKEYQKKLWWKKYITQLQMFQFGSIIIHTLFILNPSCDYPKFVVFLNVPQNLLVLNMFWDFYKKAYLSKASKQK